MEAAVYRRDEGEKIGGPTTVKIKATGRTDRRILLSRRGDAAARLPRSPAAWHRRLHDMFHVLEGTLTMRVEEATLELEAGSFVCVPPGVVHTFSDPSDAAVRVLNFNTRQGGRATCASSVRRSQAEPQPRRRSARSRRDMTSKWQKHRQAPP
jgi:mannose-6-phosphate isomerase-like protein (cupin superfamily)